MGEKNTKRTQLSYITRRCPRLWIPACSLTLTSCMALRSVTHPYRLWVLICKTVIKNQSWNNKPVSTLETQMYYVNASCYYAWSSFYELLKENLTEHPSSFSANWRSQNKSLLCEKSLLFFNRAWTFLTLQAHFVKCLSQSVKLNLENEKFLHTLWNHMLQPHEEWWVLISLIVHGEDCFHTQRI